MANTIFGGFMEGIGPAIQQGREGQLKQQMLKMQMQQYEQEQQKFQIEQQREQRRQALGQQIQAETDPVKKRALFAQGALEDKEWKTAAALGGPPAPTIEENFAKLQKFLNPGQGEPGNVYTNQTEINPTLKSDGSYSFSTTTARPAGKLSEVAALIQSVGGDINDRATQMGALKVMGMTGEAQSLEMDNFQNQFGGRGGQPQPQPSGAGMELTSPTGARVMVANPETLAEMRAQGWPMVQGEAIPQQQAPRGGRRATDNPYDVIRGKETAAAIERAGGSERARTLNEGLNKEERSQIGAVQTVMGAVEDLGALWEPGFTGIEARTGAGREAVGAMSDKETSFRTIYSNLKRLDVRATAGLTQTATELENAIAALGEPNLADNVFRARLATVKTILTQAQAIDEQLMTAPRGEVPGILQHQRATRQPYGGKAQPQAGGNEASEGTIIKNPSTGARLQLRNGRWEPVEPR